MRDLLGKVNNLNMFIHPKYNESFEFMDDFQSINLAKKLLKEFIKTKYKSIVVIESGTSPLISIMKKLKEYKNVDFRLIQIKIPRDLNFNLYEWFKTYLTKEELNEIIKTEENKSRKDILKEMCNNFNLEEFVGNEDFTIYDSVKDNKIYDNSTYNFRKILKGTGIYRIFNKSFLLFDEYINAGTIIRNFNGIVRLFTENPNFKLSAYCMFLDNPEKYEKIAFTLYDNSTELKCYKNGAYPFENRIDLIGYYYFISENYFEKVYLNELDKSLNNEKVSIDISNFYNYLNKMIDTNKLLDKLKENLLQEQVKQYVTNSDIIRFLLKYLDEKVYGKNRYSDFLDQVFELYAPAWSPMPTIFHLDYWSGFNKILNKIDEISVDIQKSYTKYRFSIIKDILKILQKNKTEWEENINRNLEELK